MTSFSEPTQKRPPAAGSGADQPISSPVSSYSPGHLKADSSVVDPTGRPKSSPVSSDFPGHLKAKQRIWSFGRLRRESSESSRQEYENSGETGPLSSPDSFGHSRAKSFDSKPTETNRNKYTYIVLPRLGGVDSTFGLARTITWFGEQRILCERSRWKDTADFRNDEGRVWSIFRKCCP